jgi:hypothetical protein
MTLQLDAFQSTLTRPVDPTEPNGIAHATSDLDIGDGAATKAERAATKIAYSQYVQDYRVANYVTQDSSGPAEFPDNGEIDYADD